MHFCVKFKFPRLCWHILKAKKPLIIFVVFTLLFLSTLLFLPWRKCICNVLINDNQTLLGNFRNKIMEWIRKITKIFLIHIFVVVVVVICLVPNKFTFTLIKTKLYQWSQHKIFSIPQNYIKFPHNLNFFDQMAYDKTVLFMHKIIIFRFYISKMAKFLSYH